ncbi:MAG: helix-turn-helix domain-containing protein, partial [bacterium]
GIIKNPDNDSCYFFLHCLECRRMVFSQPVVPMKTYCLESRYEYKEASIKTQFWVDGVPAGNNETTYLKGAKNHPEIRMVLGNPNQKGHGHPGVIYFDNFTVSRKYIGVNPHRPEPVKNEISKEYMVLISSPFKSRSPNDKHIQSQWQIGSRGNFSTPYYHSGITDVFMEKWQIPTSIRITDGLYGRVRYKGNQGLWSGWSRAAELTVRPEKVFLPQWNIKGIEIYDAENGKLTDTLRKFKWYDFKIILGQGGIWKNLSFADLWLEYARNAEISPVNRKQFTADNRRNYWFSLSIGTPGLYAKVVEGTDASFNVTNTNGLFWSDSLSHFRINREEGWVSTRLRLLNQAKSGLWTVNAFARKRNKEETPVYTSSFIVSNPSFISSIQVHKKSFYNKKMIIPLSAFITALLIITILKIIPGYRKIPPPAVLSRQRELMESAMKFIQENYSDYNLSRTKIAQSLNISESYLGKIFRSEHREKITDYVNNLRIKKTKKLLIESNIKIVDIAMQVGFKEISHFYATFKKSEKTTPKQFREKNQVKIG